MCNSPSHTAKWDWEHSHDRVTKKTQESQRGHKVPTQAHATKGWVLQK